MLATEELEGRLRSARRELYELRFRLAVGQLENHRQIRRVRKDIARILTVMHQRRWEEVSAQLAEQPQPPEPATERAAVAAQPELEPVAAQPESASQAEADQPERAPGRRSSGGEEG